MLAALPEVAVASKAINNAAPSGRARQPLVSEFGLQSDFFTSGYLSVFMEADFLG